MFARKILIHKRNKFALISLCVAASQALIPSTLLGFHSLTHWADQSYFLRSMQELEASQGATSPSAMGLGYAAVIQLFKQFFGSYEVALVGLSVLSFLIIYSILIQNAFYIEDKIRKVFSILVIALSYVLLRIPLIRDIPWSHFVFAALLFLSIVVFNSPSMRIDVKYFTIGYLGFLLWQIRNFESTAIVLGLIFCSVIYLLICPSDLKVKKLKNKSNKLCPLRRITLRHG